MANSPRAGVLAAATAWPEHRMTQAEAKQFARSFFGDEPDVRGAPALERLFAAYDNTGVETRWIGRPLSWLEQPHTLPNKNQAYVEQALLLSHRCASAAIERSGVKKSELGAIVFASSTGISTPSLDAKLVQTLDLPRGHRTRAAVGAWLCGWWGRARAGAGAGDRAREAGVVDRVRAVQPDLRAWRSQQRQRDRGGAVW